MDELSKTNDKIDHLSEIIKSNQSQIEVLSAECESLQYKCTNLSIRSNEAEQRERNRGMRIINFKVPDEIQRDSILTQRYVYDKILHSIFEKAVADNLIDNIPQVNHILEYGHILPLKPIAIELPPGHPRSKAPEIKPVIIKFLSRNFKEICCRYKKVVLDDLNAANGTQIRMYDDLTRVNSSCIRRLKSDPSINKDSVHALMGRIRYKLKDEPTVWKYVVNPLSVDVAEMSVHPARKKTTN